MIAILKEFFHLDTLAIQGGNPPFYRCAPDFLDDSRHTIWFIFSCIRSF